jgi:hypothetical protein
MQYSIVKTNGQEFITVIIAGADAPFATNDANPNYEKIVAKVRAEDDEGLADLFDPSKAAAAKFESLSERVSVKAGRVYLDGDEIDNTLTEQIVRFIDAGVDDWQPLVAFFENVAENPNEHSREQLFTFLRENGSQLTITPDGYIVGYKGVRTRTNEESGEPEFVSIQSGYAIVDGTEVNGQVPNNPGSVVEMPRSRVTHDPYTACSHGLHVAAFNYASTWTSVDAVLEVAVNPRDVVSVPNDHSAQKVRVCRYQVIDVADEPYDTPVLV